MRDVVILVVGVVLGAAITVVAPIVLLWGVIESTEGPTFYARVTASDRVDYALYEDSADGLSMDLTHRWLVYEIASTDDVDRKLEESVPGSAALFGTREE